MDTNEKVSVIIPVYNDEKYLKQCVESVLTQTYTNLEIILVDDGSTDHTPEICEKYREKYDQIRVLHKKNGGVGSSRNAGLALATGEYVLFVDHDDWLDQHHIEDLYNLAVKNKADIAAGNFNIFYDDKSTFAYWLNKDSYFEKDYSIKEWFSLQYRTDYYNMSLVFTVPWDKLYKRSLFKNIVYPENVPVEDDLTTWKIYLLANKIAYENKAIYTHRILKSSVSASVSETDVFPLRSIEERITILRLIGFDTSNEESAYRYRLEKWKNHALDKGEYLKYRDTLQKLAILEKWKN
ncbi:glycosyltransferase family 2 protein [Lactobacillus paragasseri]|uniref:glycosyltransferase family 2 protein n=1 Tax=Lactobacillus paragasseri TaxID=2107999 RepID=UPI0012E1C811|nr:glycosyltransferase family 2 protein [Lactobacillus paragasseri]MDK8087059.1 glycosyltransferase family 2 protein [Lactobacillus paragasseri]MDX5118999.1 glycosyltransferase family 2 protein [Lactobacillus paragasseri]MDX5122872.1 glycosyltransferase family 2 protein [Lactobacillus paragasseri]QGT98217.1 glycosyltransferase family 2 protein [Lactobacillus paragasseri]UWI47638.1 glycosyltransferase family 2 protein [Lactobacillus paragasseri]